MIMKKCGLKIGPFLLLIVFQRNFFATEYCLLRFVAHSTKQLLCFIFKTNLISNTISYFRVCIRWRSQPKFSALRSSPSRLVSKVSKKRFNFWRNHQTFSICRKLQTFRSDHIGSSGIRPMVRKKQQKIWAD